MDSVYVQRPHATRDDWNPSTIKSARRSAELGNLRAAADLVEHIQTDDRASGVLSTRVRGLLKCEVRFEDAESDDATPITQALEADFWDAYPENDLAQLASWGLMLGVGLGEHRWDVNEYGRLVPRLRVWHPRWLRWDHRNHSWLLQTEGGDVELDLESGEWILYTPFGSHEPWRHGLYRSVSAWWLLKRYAISDWGGYSEAHGNPIRVGTSEMDTGKEYRTELAEDLQNIAGITGMGMPPGVKVELLEATARTWETFQAQVEAANTSMAVAIAGQNLTSEVQGGSYAAATVHDSIRRDLIESDEQALSTSLHEQMISPWAAMNYGDAPVPWVRWETTPENRQEIYGYHLEAGVITRNEMRDRLGLPPLDEGGDELIRSGQEGDVADDAGVLSRRVALTASAPGMVRGQAYVDRLATRGEPLQAVRERALELSRLLEEAGSYDEVLAGLPAVVGNIDDAGPLLEALLMAAFAGVVSETEDG